jgi:hypothetical protein
MIETEVIKRSVCYVSTPEHIRSFYGRFIWIYTGKGELTLTESALEFLNESGLLLEIPLISITDIEVGHYSRWAKPFRLDYISVSYLKRGRERMILFTPPGPLAWMTSVWKTNKIVAEWVMTLQDALSRFIEAQGSQDHAGE